jgi:hypothetical protein
LRSPALAGCVDLIVSRTRLVIAPLFRRYCAFLASMPGWSTPSMPPTRAFLCVARGAYSNSYVVARSLGANRALPVPDVSRG